MIFNFLKEQQPQGILRPNLQGYMSYISEYLNKNTIELRLEDNQNNVQKLKNIVLVLHSAYDPQHAFNEDGDEGLFEIFKRMEYFTFIYKKVSNYNDIEQTIKNLDADKKIAHLIIMAHGTKTSIQISQLEKITSGLARSSKDIPIARFANIIKPKLEKDCSILLHSCSTGEGGLNENNFAKTLSNLLPGHVIYGSEEPIARGDLIVSVAEEDYKRGILQTKYEIDKKKSYNIFSFMNINHKGGYYKNTKWVVYKTI